MTAELVGSVEPRLWTPPLTDLGPATSAGFECVRFAESVLGLTLDPWQRFALVHALELNPDGTLRLRTALILVGRQNGKTLLLSVIILWAMYSGRARLVLGAAQNLTMARELWEFCVDLATNACHETRAEIANVRRANGEQELRLVNGARYKITAVSRSAGRGLSVGLLVLDELREHRSWEGWSALSATTSARPGALTVATSNAGDDTSVVLNSLRAAALDERDPALGIFEWSAPEDCDIGDRDGWAAANPSLGHGRLSERVLETAFQGEPANVFRTERLCQRVGILDSAVDLTGWAMGADASGSIEGYRDRIAACLDVSMDGAHVTLTAAVELPDGRVRVEPIAAWWSTADCRDELPALLDELKPVQLAWFPGGPSNALAPLLEKLDYAVALTGSDVTSSCMSFSDLAAAGRVLHNADSLLDTQLAGASRLPQGDGFRFTRRGQGGHCDAVYAAAGAVHAALTLPPAVPAWDGPLVIVGKRKSA